METLREFSDVVEVVGIDEAYVDLSGSPVPQSRAREIKRRGQEATRLVCSIGLAPNKLMAKIASDLDKPDGLCVLDDEEMARGGRREARDAPARRRAEDLRAAASGSGSRPSPSSPRADAATLARDLRAQRTARRCATAPTASATAASTTERKRKSESRETTFAHRRHRPRPSCVETVDRLARSVCESLEEHGNAGRTVTMKIRLRPFRTYTRSRTLASPTRDAEP